MPKPISGEKITLMKQAFRKGKSIPECALLAECSTTTAKKYLKDEIDNYINAIAPESSVNLVMTDETIKDDRDRLPEEMPLTDDQFITLIEWEFSECQNMQEAKDLFWHHKPRATLNERRVSYFRTLYEKTLQRLNGEQYTESASNASIIETYKKAWGCRIPISKGCNSWSHERLVEHVCYWRLRSQYSHKACIQWLEENTELETRQAYLNS